MSVSYVRVERDLGPKWRTCGFRGCSSFASHILCAGTKELCFCCAQCAAYGIKESVVPDREWRQFSAFRNQMSLLALEEKKASEV